MGISLFWFVICYISDEYYVFDILDVATQKDLLAAPLPRNSIHPSSGAIASLRLLTTIDWSNKHDACVRTVSEEIQVSASRLKLRHLVTISEDILTRLGMALLQLFMYSSTILCVFFRTQLRIHSTSLCLCVCICVLLLLFISNGLFCFVLFYF